MEMYKEASRMNLLFPTSRGNLTVSQLWTLSMTAVGGIVKAINKQIKEVEGDNELSFLDETAKPADKALELQFNIAKDIYLTKKSEREAIVNESEKKQQLQELLAIKAERQKEAMKDISNDDLDKKIAELSK